jgi:uncharacterized protein YjbI with pentapeptide repeats
MLLLALAFAWPRPALAEPLQQAAQVQCLHQATPPSPPAGGAVIAGKFDPTGSEPNVVVIPAGAKWQTGDCGTGAPTLLAHPVSIAVSGPPQPAALSFQDSQHDLYSPWGAINVAAGAPAPVLYPGHSEFTPTTATVEPPAYFAIATGSCRSCWLKDVPETLPPPISPKSNGAFWGDLSGATLSGATFSPIDNLSGVPLSKVNLSNAKLDGVKGLSGANLSQANLSGADLTGTDLSTADLTGAKLTGASLSGVNLSGVRGLNAADLSGASLARVNLSGLELYGSNLSGADLSRANLSSANAYSVNLSNANLSGADLSAAGLQGANLNSANLSGANLGEAHLECLHAYQNEDGTFGCLDGQSDLRGANLQNAVGLNTARLLGAMLSGAQGLQGSNLSGADLRVSDASKADLSDADLSQADLTGVNLEQADLSGAKLVGTKGLAPGVMRANLTGTKLSRAKLHGTDLHGAELANAALTSADLSGANLAGANLSNATLTSADLTGANLQQTDLRQATLTSANLTGANLQQANLTAATMPSLDLSDQNLSGAILTGANLHQANLSQASLGGATLTGVDLSGANLTGTPGFSRSDLAGKDLSGANLSGASGLAKAALNNVNLSGAKLTQTNLSGANLDSANLAGTDLSGSNLSGASLRDAKLTQTQVSGTDFDGAAMEGTQTVKLQFEAPPSFSGISMGQTDSGCTLIKDTDLSTATFTMNGLSGVCLINSPLLPGSTVRLDAVANLWQKGFYNVDLSHATFVVDASNRSALAGKDLSQIHLSGSAFVGWPVDLSGAHLEEAILDDTTLDLADLAGAYLQRVHAPGASFRGASLAAHGSGSAADFGGSTTNLQGAIFVDANVSGANFSSANLSGAVFSRALAVGTDFNGVIATNASYTGAHIYGNGQAFDNATDLQGVDFNNAVLAGDISQGGGFDLTHTDLTGATFDNVQCIGCNFTGSTLDDASFSSAYLIGAVFSGAKLQGTNLYDAWLYCGNLNDSRCDGDSGLEWQLALGFGEASGPVRFLSTDLTGVSLQDVKICPNGQPPTADGCVGSQLLADQAGAPPIPAACSSAAFDACPTATSEVFDASQIQGRLLSVASRTPATWSTTLTNAPGYAVAFDDGTVRSVGDSVKILAGSPGKTCQGASQTCGDGGPASQALLGTPAGLAVGRDGSLYIADSSLHRVRKIDSSGTISTVAGGAESATTLEGPYAVWINPLGQLFIADGRHGLRQADRDGTLSTVHGTDAYDVRGVVGDASGSLYVATRNPDHIVEVKLSSGQASEVVGTGTSGYNGNTDSLTGLLLPGTSVQINAPGGLSVDLQGNILFADTGNHLVRAYVPSSGSVIDDLGGVTPGDGVTQAGCTWADQTRLDAPAGVTATAGAMLVVADTGNQRVLMLGPSPLDETSPPVCPNS